MVWLIWIPRVIMNQKGAGSFFFLLGENSGIHQEAKQTNRYGSSDGAGPQAPSANKDLTLEPSLLFLYILNWFKLWPLPRVF